MDIATFCRIIAVDLLNSTFGQTLKKMQKTQTRFSLRLQKKSHSSGDLFDLSFLPQIAGFHVTSLKFELQNY